MCDRLKIKLYDGYKIFVGEEAKIIMSASMLIRNIVNDLNITEILMDVLSVKELDAWALFTIKYVSGEYVKLTTEIINTNEYLNGFDYRKTLKDNIIEMTKW